MLSYSALTGEERETVVEQTERILAHGSFRKSDRCSRLLRYMVDQALADSGPLKERTIGYEVYGRTATYDTAIDPVVRNAASEIRRRLAQFYQEAEAPGSVRISLPAGTYVPEFHFDLIARTTATQIRVPDVATPTIPPNLVLAGTKETTPYIRMTAAGLFVLAAVILGFLWVRSSHQNLPVFWSEFYNSRQGVLVSSGHIFQPEPSSSPGQPAKRLSRAADSATTTMVTSLLSQNGVRLDTRTDEETSFNDLRTRPSVLVGALNNAWTMKMTTPLRYHFEIDREAMRMRIADSTQPAMKLWSLPLRTGLGWISEDFGLISRFRDPSTGMWVVSIAGLDMNGTEAAGMLVSDEQFLRQVPRRELQKGRNLQIVVRTHVQNGRTGPPEVLAVYSW